MLDWISQHFIEINLYFAIQSLAFCWLSSVSGANNSSLSYISPAMMSVPTFGIIFDPERYDIYLVCLGMMLMGCLYQFGRMYGKNELSWKYVLQQIMIAIPLSILSYATWLYAKSSWPIHIMLFFVGAFSTVIANIFDKVSTMGIREAAVRAGRYLLGKIDEGDNHDRNASI